MYIASSPIRIGIIGCAEIVRRMMWQAINAARGASLHAISSRSLQKARKFAADNVFPASVKVYGSYEEVIDDPDVDAVYVPLPTTLHVKWVLLAAQKKKHVMLEKPVALNAVEFDAMMEACESNGVQLMDATMWMHHPRTAEMKEFISDPKLFGQLKYVHSVFTFNPGPDFLENNIRVKPDLDTLGVLGDAGWYCIRAILWAADFELPKSVIAQRNPVFNSAGVVMSCGASLYWKDGKVATFHCSFLSDMAMDATAVGTNGTLHLHGFVLPYEEKTSSYMSGTRSGFDELVTGWESKPTEHVVANESTQQVLMFEEFSRIVASIKYDGSKPEKMWPMFSRKTQLVLDAVLASIEKCFEPVEVIS